MQINADEAVKLDDELVYAGIHYPLKTLALATVDQVEQWDELEKKRAKEGGTLTLQDNLQLLAEITGVPLEILKKQTLGVLKRISDFLGQTTPAPAPPQ
jgi:hypothetical protein